MDHATPASGGLRFNPAHEPLSAARAVIEAERCYDCYDAPCIAACPTGIDIPAFIRRIAQDNPRGAAREILEANIFGGLCARDCPIEVLCEAACVRNAAESKPVEIALLQRFATDAYFADPAPAFFTRAAPTGRRVAIVGGGPAGLACAHRLSLLGHDTVVYDAREKLGGLNEYGIASYKTPDDFAAREIAWLLSIGGIEPRPNTRLGRDIFLDTLLREYDAVFLALGLAGVNALAIPAPEPSGIRDAIDFIAELRQTPHTMKIPRRVLVIGGGMTAVDAAVQSRMLGAEDVTIAYRRGPDAMPASEKEQDWARVNNVAIRHFAAPIELIAPEGRIQAVRFARTRMEAGRLAQTDETFLIETDLVLKAIGQTFTPDAVGATIALKDNRIATDPEGRTSHPRLWAGGDCRHGGRDLTVEAVRDGKTVALAIDRALRA